MIVMPSNNSNAKQLAEQFPGKVGWLLSPAAGFKTPPESLPYAVDNGAFSAYKLGTEWDEQAFFELLARTVDLPNPPLWIVAPDVVGDRVGTLIKWRLYRKKLRAFGVPLAFAVQDGMIQADVPADADVVFVGGTTRWKWRTMAQWCKDNARVHVARVNGIEALRACADARAESCDGTGWFRGSQRQLAKLLSFLQSNSPPRTLLNARNDR